MEFDLESALQILERTPKTLDALLRDLPDNWARVTEGPETWSAYDVVGHLIHGDHTDWIPRARVILEHGAGRAFEPFDRFAQVEASRGKSLNELLDEFAAVRARSLAELAELKITPDMWGKEGRHPDLGAVTLGQLLSTWVAHDLDHLVQISRVMAKAYTDEVGPWRQYLKVLK
jgi:DinB superfamily